jgi:aminoglycoside 6'-N-acetyltransferase I
MSTLTKAELCETVGHLCEIRIEEAGVIVDSILDTIARAVRAGKVVAVRDFGIFRLHKRQARMGRNPKSGERVKVPAKGIAVFRPSTELKKLVLNLDDRPRERVIVRPTEERDTDRVASMFHSLWPHTSTEEHSRALLRLMSTNGKRCLPWVVLVAEHRKRGLAGFLYAGLRSHADGCDSSRPVAYVEGWYVDPPYRRRRVGAQLLAAAEDWARRQGCTEMASDTWIDNLDSQHAHESLGFAVVDRCVNYRKNL